MKNIFCILLLSISISSFSQETLSDLLNMFNEKSIPYISVQELAMPKTNAILLDSREQKEYNVSHLKNAICVGYDNFDIESIEKQIPNKDQDIVVYCSLGIRSEDVAEKLKAKGYTNVKNLYGGIFEWKNNNFAVFDIKNKETENVHTFNKEWSKWLTNGVKVYEKRKAKKEKTKKKTS